MVRLQPVVAVPKAVAGEVQSVPVVIDILRGLFGSRKEVLVGNTEVIIGLVESWEKTTCWIV